MEASTLLPDVAEVALESIRSDCSTIRLAGARCADGIVVSALVSFFHASSQSL